MKNTKAPSSSTLPGIASLPGRKPPRPVNPSLISQAGKQRKPITLPQLLKTIKGLDDD